MFFVTHCTCRSLRTVPHIQVHASVRKHVIRVREGCARIYLALRQSVVVADTETVLDYTLVSAHFRGVASQKRAATTGQGEVSVHGERCTVHRATWNENTLKKNK